MGLSEGWEGRERGVRVWEGGLGCWGVELRGEVGDVCECFVDCEWKSGRVCLGRWRIGQSGQVGVGVQVARVSKMM